MHTCDIDAHVEAETAVGLCLDGVVVCLLSRGDGLMAGDHGVEAEVSQKKRETLSRRDGRRGMLATA